MTEVDASILRAEGLTKVYARRKVVNEVALEVRQGEIVGLLGPNGAGKTTSFYMVVGLIAPDRGRVFLDQKELTRVPMFKRARLGVGYLAQEPSVFRKLSVEDNVKAILETLPLSRSQRKERLEGLLNELSISHLRKSKAYALSGGERRRLEITRALVQEPKFMLLDEPFAGIDPIAVNDIQQIVASLKDRGIGVIISDHNVEQTLDIVDRAYIMYEGRIRVSGTVSELVWNDEVAEIYLGPTLTQRMRNRYPKPEIITTMESIEPIEPIEAIERMDLEDSLTSWAEPTGPEDTLTASMEDSTPSAQRGERGAPVASDDAVDPAVTADPS
jgi:lipopolysaccharide export system ATP-binding protein